MSEQNKEDQKDLEDFTVDMSSSEDNDFSGLDKLLSEQVTEAMDGAPGPVEPPVKKKNWFTRIPLALRITVIGLLSVVLVLGLYVNYSLDRMITDFNGDHIDIPDEVDENPDNLPEKKDEEINWNQGNTLRKEDDVINILLVGEEAIGMGESRGRTDSIMVATVNFKQKAMKLTSFMRDLYVQIPGYNDNKLNSAYASGGMPLLEQTIEKNFDIEIDGCVLVNFDGFENVIDRLGGVELTLSSAEANYLNTTNYVSDPNNRTLRSGTQTLNGNQALGYMRIRYVRTADNVSDDFGRTQRQRTLLNAVFEKYKHASLPEMLLLANDLIQNQYIQTDLEKTQIIDYVTRVVTMGPTVMETMRIPNDNMYEGCYIRKMAVLLPYLPENVEAFHKFLFGEDAVNGTGTASGSSVTASGGAVDSVPATGQAVSPNRDERLFQNRNN